MKTKRVRKTKAVEVDTKKLAANDRPEAEAPKPPARNASAVAKGAAYHKLAGSPSKPAVVACFGKSGYAKSWLQRAEKLGIPAEELCAKFAANPQAVKESWAKATAPVSK